MNILLVGCGRMGGAMARAWSQNHHVFVYDPAQPAPSETKQIDVLDSAALPADLIVVLAVKPQVFPGLAPALGALAARDRLFVSIMAGVTLAGLEAALGGTGRVVRAMPNTPAAIGRGISAAIRGRAVTDGDAVVVESLLQATGAVVWLHNESDMDAVTAVSGSGPAYFFRFTEALAAAGIAAGLKPDLAMKLARATFTGTAALAAQDECNLSELRQQVTSPGGTTAAGLAKMDEGGRIDELVREVVVAAAARSRQLAG